LFEKGKSSRILFEKGWRSGFCMSKERGDKVLFEKGKRSRVLFEQGTREHVFARERKEEQVILRNKRGAGFCSSKVGHPAPPINLPVRPCLLFNGSLCNVCIYMRSSKDTRALSIL